MILRLGMNAAAHTAAGFALGVTGVFAACTLAATANHLRKAAPRTALGARFEDAMPDPRGFDRSPPDS